MKRAHRKLHFLIWAILAPIIFCVVLLAVMHRQAEPVNDVLPGVISEEPR